MYLTYTVKLLQTKGKKGRALHEAMRRWTDARAEFLDWCRDHVSEFVEACATINEKTGKTSYNRYALISWIRQNIKPLATYQQLESSLKNLLIFSLAAQLMSFIELHSVQEHVGFPNGRLDRESFEHYLDEFTCRDWTPMPGDDVNHMEREYLRTAGIVQGYSEKTQYAPIEYNCYDKYAGYRLARSEDGQYFAILFLLPDDTGFRLNNSKPIYDVRTGEQIKSVSKKAAMFPVSAERYTMWAIAKYRPASARLLYRDGEFYLQIAVAVNVPEPKPYETILSISRGVVPLASIVVTDIDGTRVLHRERVDGYGLHKNRVEDILRKIQRAQSRGAHYTYKYGKINDEAARTTANTIIRLAKRYRSMIVLEDLSTQMRSRMMPNLARKRHANIYARMQQVLEYKAQLAGIQTDMVSTHWTRQTCPRCGFISTENKIKIEEESGRHVAYFSCRECGYQDDADAVAAINIARRAVYKRSCTEARHSGKMKVTWEEFAKLIVSVR